MGRPLKLTETVGGYLKVGEIGNTSSSGNQIQGSAFIPAADGGTAAANAYITKQVSGRRYKVTNSEGSGIVKLVATSPAAGEMRVTVTDSAGGTYYATKITKHRVQVTAATGTQFTTGASVPWTFDSPTEDVNVQMTAA